MSRNSKCPVCSSFLIDTFLKRQNVPVHQNLLMKSQKLAVEINRGDLTLALCKDCGFIFNQDFDVSRLDYSSDYDNTQSCSASFNKYTESLVRYLLYEKLIQNQQIIEVGCGKGVFLRKMIEDRGSGNTGYGFDTSYVGPDSDLDGRLKFKKSYYGPEHSHIRADVVICRHVIEHVADPVVLLGVIRQALQNSSKARVFLETPCVEWILRHQVVWDFFYEHCSYFTAESLTTAFEVSGFRVESVQHVFQNQYLLLEATVSSHAPQPITNRPGFIPDLAKRYTTSEHTIRKELKSKTQELASNGKVALWGAGAKGVTFANLVDPNRELIACVVDLNPEKQGCYIPGTGHPIVDYSGLNDFDVKTAILMNPNYRDENIALLRNLHIDINLVDMIEYEGVIE